MTSRKKNEFNVSPLAVKLQQKMKRDGFKLIAVSEHIGLSHSYIGAFLNGALEARKSRRSSIEKIAKYLNISVALAYKLAGTNDTDQVKEKLPSQSEYIAKIRTQLNLSKKEASAVFGLGKSSFSHFEVSGIEAPKLLLILFKTFEQRPKLFAEIRDLSVHPDPRQAHTMYFTNMRKKLKLTKQSAAKLFGLGKGAFIQIESSQRKASLLLEMVLKLIENHPKIFSDITEL